MTAWNRKKWYSGSDYIGRKNSHSTIIVFLYIFISICSIPVISEYDQLIPWLFSICFSLLLWNGTSQTSELNLDPPLNAKFNHSRLHCDHSAAFTVVFGSHSKALSPNPQPPSGLLCFSCIFSRREPGVRAMCHSHPSEPLPLLHWAHMNQHGYSFSLCSSVHVMQQLQNHTNLKEPQH